MAYDTWGGSWGTTWAVSWTRDSLPVLVVTPSRQQPAGKPRRGKRKKWVIDGQTLTATPEEIEQYLEARLERERATEPEEHEAAEEAAERPTVAPRDRAIVTAFPTYPGLRDMLLAAKEIEAAQILRRVAKRLADDEDERDIEMLLLH